MSMEEDAAQLRRQQHEDDGHGHPGDVDGPLPGMKVSRGDGPAYFNPLDQPAWVRANSADEMRDDDFILGISVAEGHYALPWWVMKNHHVANLRFPNVSLVVALCENCSSGAAFNPVVDGKQLSFRVAGTYNGTFFIKDLETTSYWAPFIGEGIYGHYLGEILEPFPLYQCYWSEWKELHPDTFVERGEGEPRDGHGSEIVPGSMGKAERRMVKSIDRDRRLRPNVLVLGVRVNGKSRAYPIDVLHESPPALNDIVGGEPIVIFSRPQSLIGMAFSRELDGQILNLNAIDTLKFRDEETGSEWDIEGKAVSGPLTGKRLKFVKSTVEEWYAFAAAAKEVDVFGSKPKEEIEAQPHLKANRQE